MTSDKFKYHKKKAKAQIQKMFLTLSLIIGSFHSNVIIAKCLLKFIIILSALNTFHAYIGLRGAK